MIKLTATGIGYGCVALTILLSGDRIASSIGANQVAVAERREEAKKRGQLQQRAANEKQLAFIAMERVKAPCIPMVVKGSDGQPVTLQPGMSVYNTDGQPLTTGIGCSADGSTAEIWDGTAQNIARVAPEQRAEYDEFFSKQR